MTWITMLFALLLPHIGQQAALCTALDILHIGQVVEWSDAAYTRGELPDDLRLVRFVYLTNPTLPDGQVQALEFEWSAERGELWLIAYASMTVSADGGMHDICPVRKLSIRGVFL